MTDHEQQAIEKLTDIFVSRLVGGHNNRQDCLSFAKAAVSSLKASGYQYIPEGFVVVPKEQKLKVLK